jgi:Holliday junction resolvasome RuvABC endonuclease subunit
MRFGDMLMMLPTILKRTPSFDVVVYETPFARGRDATRSMWGIAGILEACANRANIAVVDVAVPTIKKFATGHGHAAKNDMIAAAKKFGYLGFNDNEADAICLLKYAEANLEYGDK